MRRALVIALVCTFGIVAPVAAAAPPNDTFAGATVVSIGSTVTQDTTEAAQTDPFETSLNDFCGAPAVEHGVWFTFTAPAEGFVAFDTNDSNYPAGIMVFGGAPTPDGLLTCGPGRVALGVSNAQQYSVLVFGYDVSTATAGTMTLHVLATAPPPTIDLTVNRTASVNKAGVVRLTGTVTCTSADGSGTLFEVFGQITQRVGRLLISGFFDNFLDLPCDGSPHNWEAFAQGDNGIFAGGKAATIAIAFGCTADFCSEGFVEATVQLRRNGH
jgi:hypothetical protein